MRTHSNSNLWLLCLAWTTPAWADFEPIALNSDCFNQDVVVEKTAPCPVTPVTTASMESGTQNSGFTWFERGYVTDWLAAGLPEAGSIFESEQSADHQFRMPPSYETNNAFLIDAVHPAALLTFSTPSNYTALSFLTSSGLSKNVLGYVLRHQDGTTQSGTFTSPNWYSVADPAWAANGRVNVASFVLSDINSYNPKLYAVNIQVANTFKPITAVELYLTNGLGHTVVFAISGVPLGAGPFVPVEISGYTEDLVVEAAAPKPGFLNSNTTATMDNGTANLRSTWYEQGYNPLAPQSGLPPAGSIVVSETDAGHRFLLPASYSAPNAILLDRVCTNSVLKLLTPAAYTSLSFLTASAHGPVTNRCVFSYADGTTETNQFVSPDWLGDAPSALRAHGLVSVSTRLLDQVGADTVRLYAVDVSPTNQGAPILSIGLSPEHCATDAHAIVFAVSGISKVVVPPTRPQLQLTRNRDGSFVLHSSQPGRLQACTDLTPGAAAWNTEGPISSNITFTPGPQSKAAFYRVIVP
jgi:hypothetical protein